MSTAPAAAQAPRVVRSIPGRLRAHLPNWEGARREELERALASIPGVVEASARPETGNVLIRFDARTEADEILERLAELSGRWAAPAAAEAASAGAEAAAARTEPEHASSERKREPTRPPTPGERAERGGKAAGEQVRSAAAAVTGVLREQAGRFGRARIAVRGIDRDPALARRVVAALERRPDVRRAIASATTGRVLVEFSEEFSSLQDVLADLSKVELPDVPGEDHPAHPLDRGPIIQSGARVIGSALGLGWLALRSITSPGAQGSSASAAVAGTLGLVDGAPPLRNALRKSLGHDRAQLVLGGAAIASLTFSGSPLGLLVSGAGALRVFTEARLRRESWKEYEQRLEHVSEAQAGAVVRLDAGARVPLTAQVLEGRGTVIGRDGLPDPVAPGDTVPSGARLLCGPLVLNLVGDRAWDSHERAGTPRPDPLARYVALLSPAALAYAVVQAIRRRSLAAAFTGLLLVNPRAAVIGADAADGGASARVLRAGVTVVGTRPERQVRKPDVLVIDGPRVLSDGLEQASIVPCGNRDRHELAQIVAALAATPGAPWGSVTAPGRGIDVSDAELDGTSVSAIVAGRRLRLELVSIPEQSEESRRAFETGEQALVLRDERTDDVIAHICLRPRLAAGVDELRRQCDRQGTAIAVLERDDRRASRSVARRAQMELVLEADLVELVRDYQRRGERVAVLSDTPAAAAAFDACDLAIGLTSGRSSQFQARADLLAPGLPAVAAIISAGARREQAAEIAVGLSVAGNVAGAIWGLQGEPGILRASRATYVAALGAMGAAWERLRGGRRARSIISRLTDPHPEVWGRMSTAEVLDAMRASPAGLPWREAERRAQTRTKAGRRNAFIAAMAEQLQSPLVAVLGAGAGMSLAMGATADVVIIGAVIVANAAVGAWQERQAGQAAQALERMSVPSARALRDGEVHELPADDIVPGDVIALGAGDRVVADARLLEADSLEVDEAALTGESLPVAKEPEAARPESRIVLEGSDVTVGSAKALVVAVGDRTRLGATAAALAVQETQESPLGQRLDRLFRQGLPVVCAGGLLVTVAGIAWGGAPIAQLAVGASVAVAAVPEGLPLLAGVAEAAVARRLAGRSALVRRLASVESLGRVNVVCADKTGTLTCGQLAVTMIDDLVETQDVARDGPTGPAREVLLIAGLASPPPNSPDAQAHPTDDAVLAAAVRAGLTPALDAPRAGEAPFDPVRALHASAVSDRVCVKGAAETIVPRCRYSRAADGSRRELDQPARDRLLARAEELASRGLRVLMVAEGPAESDVEDPQNLTASGLIGISDPLREGAAEAIGRCRDAGIKTIMLTGDHPATARKIAGELGLALGDATVLTGEDLEHVDVNGLEARLAEASVVARITPIDKLRIVECLQRSGHTVAMTGDGVNDAPALRLADVGVSMGAGGTEVARQAADLVLADDEFGTLTDALLEGRSLWRNLHDALGLLLGGNLGEMLMMAGAAIVGRGSVLVPRQILAINLLSDVLPAVAVAMQPPREQELHGATREGRDSVDDGLLPAILKRGVATGAPALFAVLAAPLLGAQASSVAFGSIIVTQLAQTLQSGHARDTLARPVVAAVGGSCGVLAASLAFPPLRRFLRLPAPSPMSLVLIAATGPAAAAVARVWEAAERPSSARAAPAVADRV